MIVRTGQSALWYHHLKLYRSCQCSDSITRRARARAPADRFQGNCNLFSRITDKDISSYYNADLPH